MMVLQQSTSVAPMKAMRGKRLYHIRLKTIWNMTVAASGLQREYRCSMCGLYGLQLRFM